MLIQVLAGKLLCIVGIPEWMSNMSLYTFIALFEHPCGKRVLQACDIEKTLMYICSIQVFGKSS